LYKTVLNDEKDDIDSIYAMMNIFRLIPRKLSWSIAEKLHNAKACMNA